MQVCSYCIHQLHTVYIHTYCIHPTVYIVITPIAARQSHRLAACLTVPVQRPPVSRQSRGKYSRVVTSGKLNSERQISPEDIAYLPPGALGYPFPPCLPRSRFNVTRDVFSLLRNNQQRIACIGADKRRHRSHFELIGHTSRSILERTRRKKS